MDWTMDDWNLDCILDCCISENKVLESVLSQLQVLYVALDYWNAKTDLDGDAKRLISMVFV